MIRAGSPSGLCQRTDSNSGLMSSRLLPGLLTFLRLLPLPKTGSPHQGRARGRL